MRLLKLMFASDMEQTDRQKTALSYRRVELAWFVSLVLFGWSFNEAVNAKADGESSFVILVVAIVTFIAFAVFTLAGLKLWEDLMDDRRWVREILESL